LPGIYRERVGEHLNELSTMQGTADDQRASLLERFDTVTANAATGTATRADSYFGDQQAALAVSEALRQAPVVAQVATPELNRREP